MFKRLNSVFNAVVTGVLSAALIAPAIFAAPVSAQSASSQQEPRSLSDVIESGLWGGVNAATGGSTRTTTPPATPAAPPTSQAYVALGDSVAAGVGLPTPSQVPATQTSCGRTAEAYPAEVSRTMGLPLVHIACSGATVRNLYSTSQRAGSYRQPIQINTAFQGGAPRLITITAGANDLFWDDILFACASRINCAGVNSTKLANKRLITLQTRVDEAMKQIVTLSKGRPPTVVVTGYYNPISPACATVRPTLTAAEIRWLTAAVEAINQTIKQTVVRYDFARFAPVDFTGHDICSAQPWVQGLDASRPVHPTTEGQSVIARSILRSLGR